MVNGGEANEEQADALNVKGVGCSDPKRIDKNHTENGKESKAREEKSENGGEEARDRGKVDGDSKRKLRVGSWKV